MPKGDGWKDLDVRDKMIKAMNTPEIKTKQSETMREFWKDPEKREQMINAQTIAQNKPENKIKKSETMKEIWKDTKYQENHKKLMNDPDVKTKQKEIRKKSMNDPDEKIKRREKYVGGFCIQNIIYSDKKDYCDVWGPPLWERIDEYQGYKSILSGRTKKDNGGRELTRHHLYWQEKACCGYDEDTKGYYAMINLGTRCKPNMHKHYIKGSPNKFVLLTSDEHCMIAGNKKLGTTKLSWIIYLENLVETKLGGKTFYTEEEYNKIKEAR